LTLVSNSWLLAPVSLERGLVVSSRRTRCRFPTGDIASTELHNGALLALAGFVGALFESASRDHPADSWANTVTFARGTT
jgi:hypothetical protein